MRWWLKIVENWWLMAVFPGQWIRNSKSVVSKAGLSFIAIEIFADVHQAVFASARPNQRLESQKRKAPSKIESKRLLKRKRDPFSPDYYRWRDYVQLSNLADVICVQLCNQKVTQLVYKTKVAAWHHNTITPRLEAGSRPNGDIQGRRGSEPSFLGWELVLV
jgi:hypothetical protein